MLLDPIPNHFCSYHTCADQPQRAPGENGQACEKAEEQEFVMEILLASLIHRGDLLQPYLFCGNGVNCFFELGKLQLPGTLGLHLHYRNSHMPFFPWNQDAAAGRLLSRALQCRL